MRRERFCTPRSRASSTSVEYRVDPTFGFDVPVEVKGVDTALLDPRSTWRDPEAYDRKGAELARMFRENFTRFADEVGDAVVAAGPRVVTCANDGLTDFSASAQVSLRI